MTETVRDVLDRLERDIISKIKTLREQLVPLESELGNVRRAQAALAPPVTISGPTNTTLSMAAGTAVMIPGPISVNAVSRQIDWSDAYKGLTMKELAVQALREQFKNGATANQL